MKKKLLTKTYVRDVETFNLKIFQLENCIVCVKQIVKTNLPFVTSSGLKLIDNNYQIVEVLPKNLNYAMRVFLDDNKQVVQRYFDITKQNGVDKDINVPYYEDLYLDIIIEKRGISVLDETDLDNALQKGDITQQDYLLARNTLNSLLNELKTGKNALMAMDLNKFLF